MNFPESIQMLSCSFWKHYLLLSKFSVTLWNFFLMPSLFLLAITRLLQNISWPKLNFYSCVLIWSYDPLENGPSHRHLMAVRWLDCASSFGQGDLRQKAAFCCSSGAAAGISEKSWRGQLEDKTYTKSVEEFCLVLQFHCAFVVVHRGLFFFRAVYSFSKLLTNTTPG